MRQINYCLNTRLKEICQRTILLEDLNLKISRYLPESLRDKCFVGSFNHGCLNLVVQDAVWGSQLRYLLPELRDTLRRDAGLHQLTSIKLSIAATLNTPLKPKQRPQKVLSTSAREAITVYADQCNYPPLKQALQRLGTQIAKATSSRSNEVTDDL